MSGPMGELACGPYERGRGACLGAALEVVGLATNVPRRVPHAGWGAAGEGGTKEVKKVMQS